MRGARQSQLRWDNLGYWEANTQSYQEAAERLARQMWGIGSPHVSPRVLDVGSGFGAQLSIWRSLGALDVLALEPDPARSSAAGTCYSDAPGIEVLNASAALTSKLPEASRDLVVVLDALYHFDDRLNFFSSARRVLVPDGRLIFCTLVRPEHGVGPSVALRAFGRLFEMPTGLPTAKQLRTELAKSGFESVQLTDWTEPVLGGFSAHGNEAVKGESSKRRQARVALTRRACRAAMRVGFQYVGVSATR